MTVLCNANDIHNESDVEQKIIYPLLTEAAFLAISSESVKTKSYLAPTQLDKQAGRAKGYFPDYSVWLLGMPVLIVEAKDPSVPSETGFREAALYARHLNSNYPTDLNPCRFIVATNGVTLLAGYWDQDAPAIELNVSDLSVGAAAMAHLTDFCGATVLIEHSNTYYRKVHLARGIRPFNLAGGNALINSKCPLNSFAADLSPVLRRYFSSKSSDELNREIAERAYVSSAEITEYDRVLEAMLKDRASPKKDTVVLPIRTSKNEAPVLTKAIQTFSGERPEDGQLQIIQGSVGSGKSLFARRYRDLLEPAELKAKNYWAFVDFNGSPPSLDGAGPWLCEKFLSSFGVENTNLDLYSSDVLKGVFSKKIQQKKATYEMLRSISADEETRARAQDISNWQSDVVAFAAGIGQYVNGGIGKNLVVVMDNVDKLELQNQLDAFQLSLWFMQQTRAFVILQMRDETYERFKNKPPLDTFRSGIAFHIAPPRFIDVVKRRLELGIEYLAANANEKQEFFLDNGARVLLPKGDLGNFLKVLYSMLFGTRTNVARILEALAGRDVRKALEMFVSIVTSGHLSTSAILSNVRGAAGFPISEFHIIRILMRADYRFFSENNDTITNMFHYSNDWVKPDNFLLVEVLYFLCLNRKRQGELGLEGYFCVRRICDELQKLGYDPSDTFQAVNFLLARELIVADSFSVVEAKIDDCVKIQAAGFIHLRVLCERVEYLHGVIPVTPIADEGVATKLAALVNSESQRGSATFNERKEAIETLLAFLRSELTRGRSKNPFFDPAASGATYVIDSMDRALKRMLHREERQTDANQLDLL
jgi:hypothetical protein